MAAAAVWQQDCSVSSFVFSSQPGEARITRLDGAHAPVSELRKYPVPVAPGCGASVSLKCVLEVTRKHSGFCTWALLGF